MGYIIGIDIGGTFTDAYAADLDTGKVATSKAPTTYHDLADGLFEALDLAASDLGTNREGLLSNAVRFAHGTTQTSNVMFTWVGAKTALLTTEGFRDELLIMRARGRVAGVSLAERRHLRRTEKPPKIVPADLIRGVDERIDHRGRVLVPLDEAAVELTVEQLVEEGVEALAVSLLWSPVNPEHELAIERIARRVSGDLHVSLGHRLAPVLGEYERASTAVVNAFVAPTVEEYLANLEKRLVDAGLSCPLLILQASGGVVQASEAVPITTIESGPAAGIVAVKHLADQLERPDLIGTDVGGTTFKVGLVRDAEWGVTRETTINQYTLLTPMVDLASIGAGGGSIAWIDSGRLRVGPQSAGSSPGPACYGWGGTHPTVTDADALLGFVSPQRFLGGRFALRTDLASEAMVEHVAGLFGGDPIAAAAAVRTVVDAQMGDLVRKATIERGYDPRRFGMVAYGGAGPLHAAGYGRVLGEGTEIIVPATATVFSAHGAAVSDLRTHRLRSVVPGLLADADGLEAAFRALESEASEVLARQTDGDVQVRCARFAEMRFSRQLHDVRVALPEGPTPLRERLEGAFRARYEELFGIDAIMAGAPAELLRIGVDASVAVRRPPTPQLRAGGDSPTDEALSERAVFWPDQNRWIDTMIVDGEMVLAGNLMTGPAIVERPGTSIVIPADSSARVDEFGNVIVRLGAGA